MDEESIFTIIAVVVTVFFVGVPAIIQFITRKKRKEKEDAKKQQLDEFNKSEYAKQTGESYYFTMQNDGDSFEYMTSLILQNEGKLLVKLLIPNSKIFEKPAIEETEIDSVLINNYGVFVIECKNWSGNIFIDDFDQTKVIIESNGKSKKCENPINQNEQHVRAIEKYISDEIPIYSLIVYNDNIGRMINIAPYSLYKRVLPLSQLKEYLESFKEKMEVIDDESVDTIYLNLQKYISTREQRQKHKAQVMSQYPDKNE